MKLLNCIVKFPFPEYARLTNDDASLIKLPICYCWIEIQEDGDVHYGFYNEMAKKFLSEVIGNVVSITNSNVKNCAMGDVKLGGAFLYGKDDSFESKKKLVNSFFINYNKNKILHRMGRETMGEDLGLIPLKNEEFYFIDSVNNFIINDIPLLMVKFFSPQAEDSLVLFGDDLDLAVKMFSNENNVEYYYCDDINNLPIPKW
ncbi:hypothetical protein [Rosenbergiella epipactidis]|uniref:hypothetical protein n=1 Tax=Rosenbergiella epipactidis TaxID=1544694 RepID=UPI001F4FBF03|nr:hypothetical protein [Rosenbergiella epipactidis]